MESRLYFCSVASRVLGRLLAAAFIATVPSPSVHPVICIDPGHPSETSRGAHGRSGITEIHVDMEVSRRLAARLRARNFTVVLTKSSESEFVTNRRRAEIANASGACLFLRLHCDSNVPPGTAVYYPDRVGRVDGHTGPPPTVLHESRRAAFRVHDALARRLGGYLTDRGVQGESRSRVGHRQGALTGSIFSKVPTITIEMLTLSNQHDEQIARSPTGLDHLAAALESAVIGSLDAPRE